MKLLIPFFVIALLLCGITACHKSGNNTPPPQQDTLPVWKIINTIDVTLDDVWFLNPARGFATGGNASYSSSDSGKTWSAIPGIPGSFNMHLLNAQRGALLSAQKIYITDDYINWRTKTSPTWTNSLAPDLQFTSLATCFVSLSTGLYKTTDTANTWNKVFANPVNGMFFFDDNTGFIYDYSASLPADIYKTVDGGAHWQPVSYIPRYASNSYNVMQFIDTQYGWLSRADSLFNTLDGGITWKGYKSPGTVIWDMQFLNKKIGYLAAETEIFKTIDGGQTWTSNYKLNDDSFIELFFLDEKTGWACTNKGKILRYK